MSPLRLKPTTLRSTFSASNSKTGGSLHWCNDKRVPWFNPSYIQMLFFSCLRWQDGTRPSKFASSCVSQNFREKVTAVPSDRIRVSATPGSSKAKRFFISFATSFCVIFRTFFCQQVIPDALFWVTLLSCHCLIATGKEAKELAVAITNQFNQP